MTRMNLIRKTVAVLAAAALLFTVMPAACEGFVHGAAGDPVFRTKPGKRITYSSVTVTRGTPFTLELKGKTKGAKTKAGKKSILKIRKNGEGRWEITGLKPGSTTVKVKRKGKTWKCKVKVLPYRIGKRSCLFISHRGYAEKYPENSRIALEKAAQAGFRGSAIDLVPTLPDENGVFDFAVSHDDSLKRMTSQKGFIRQTPARTIRKLKITKGRNAKKYKQKMMLLDDAVAILLKTRGIGQIEMKDVWTQEQTDRLAQKLAAKKVPDSWQIESGDVGSLKRFAVSQQKYGLSLKLNLVIHKEEEPFERIDVAAENGFDNVHIQSGHVTRKEVDHCRQKGVGIGAYAGMHTDINLIAKQLESFGLDWLCVSDIPWYE